MAYLPLISCKLCLTHNLFKQTCGRELYYHKCPRAKGIFCQRELVVNEQMENSSVDLYKGKSMYVYRFCAVFLVGL
jgi:hypothetical protein